MPIVSIRLLDLGLVFSIYLRILDYQFSGSFNLCFKYRRQGINVIKTTFDLLRIEMGSYKRRKQSPLFIFPPMVVIIKVTEQSYSTHNF